MLLEPDPPLTAHLGLRSEIERLQQVLLARRLLDDAGALPAGPEGDATDRDALVVSSVQVEVVFVRVEVKSAVREFRCGEKNERVEGWSRPADSGGPGATR